MTRSGRFDYLNPSQLCFNKPVITVSEPDLIGGVESAAHCGRCSNLHSRRDHPNNHPKLQHNMTMTESAKQALS